MKQRIRSFILITLGLALLVPPLSGQRGPTPAGRGGAQPATPTPVAPRNADGRPDLNGIWQALDGPNWNIEPHAAVFGTLPQLGAINAVPPGTGIVENGPIPYKSDALAKRAENYRNRTSQDPEARCYLPGVPRAMYLPQPFHIVQSTEFIMMVFQYAGAVRSVYMSDHKPAPATSWMGWSNGHWEGNTLVIETTGLDERTWFDRAGNFHSGDLKVIERISVRSADILNYEATIEDPNVFTRAWKISVPLYRRVDKSAQILDFKCAQFAEGLLYGEPGKQSAK